MMGIMEETLPKKRKERKSRKKPCFFYILCLDTVLQTVYNKQVCEIRRNYCAQKYKLRKATTDNITGGEKDANIQPVSKKGKTDI